MTLGVLVVVGANGKISTSIDHGASWTARTPVTSKILRAVASKPDASQAVAVGDQGAICTSSDQGVTWVLRTPPNTTDYLSCVAWTGTQWMAYGYNFGGIGGYTQVVQWTSTDGVTWSAVTWLSAGYGYNLFVTSMTLFGGFVYLVVESSIYAGNSYAGIWSNRTGSWAREAGYAAVAPPVTYYGTAGYTPVAIASNGSRLMVATQTGVSTAIFFSSPDGITWATANGYGGFVPIGLAGAPSGGWASVGLYSDARALFTPTDDWGASQPVNPGSAPSTRLLSVCWEGTLYAAGSNDAGKVFTSTTGASWTAHDTGDADLGNGVGIIPNSPPSAPTGCLPANGNYIDPTTAESFSWQFNDPDLPLDAQKAYAITFQRVLPSPLPAMWWNVGGNAMQGTEVFNTSTTSGVTIPANKIGSVGEVYKWSVSTKDQLSTAGSYSTPQLFTCSLPPTATLTGPPTTITDTTRPPLVWGYSDPESSPQESYIARIFTPEQYTAAGFDPATSTAAWDSGQVFASATTATPTVDLINGATYRFYLLVYQVGAQSAASWQYVQGTITLDPIATPGVIVSPDTDGGRMIVTVQCYDNLLTADQAAAETGSGSSWTAASNTTVAQSAGAFLYGTKSWRLTATASADISMSTAAGLTGFAVRQGKAYTAQVSLLAATSPRNAAVGLSFYDNTGTQIGATTTGSPIATLVSAWSIATVSALAPAGAVTASMSVYVYSAAAGEQHYADALAVAPGGLQPWSRGGLTTTTATVSVSDDYGLTWRELRNGTQTNTSLIDQALTFYDYEAPAGKTRSYKAIVSASIPSPIASNFSPVKVATLKLDRCWLSHPTDSTLVTDLKVLLPYAFGIGFGGQVFDPQGSSAYDIVDDVAKGEDTTLNVETITTADEALLKAILQSKSVLAYRDVFGGFWWVRVAGKVQRGLVGESTPRRAWQVPLVEVGAP